MRDLAIVNSNIITLDPMNPRAEAVLVKDGRIVSVGAETEIRSQCDRNTELLDLRGKVLLPGFIDTHVHFASTGLAKVGVFVSELRSAGEIIEAMVAAASDGRSHIRASGLDPTRILDGEVPTKQELDFAFPDRPAYIVTRDGHGALLNSKALEYVNLAQGTAGMDLDSLTGEPTGAVRGQAWDEAGGALSLLIDQDQWKQSVFDIAQDALAVGITTVHALDSAWVADNVLTHAELLPVKVVVYYQTTDVEMVQALGLPRIGGCLLIDGSLGSQTAALNEPYTDDPSSRGNLYFQDEDLYAFVKQAHLAGLQIAMHAIGDRAIQQLLDTYENVLTAYPRPDHRHRIEHFILPGEANIRRAAKLGIHVSMQPTFHHLWGGEGNLYWRRLGRERLEKMNPLLPAVEEGVVVAGGSDSAVTPMSPMLGVHAAVNDHHTGHRLNVLQALRMFTSDAARLSFEEKEKGSISPGKAADFVALAENPFEVPVGDLKDISVLLTVVDGETKFNGGGF